MKQRRAPISKQDGPCFRFDNARGMHVSTASKKDAKEIQKSADLKSLALELFGTKPQISYTELAEAIKKGRGLSPATADRRIKAMRESEIIKQTDAGLYTKGF